MSSFFSRRNSKEKTTKDSNSGGKDKDMSTSKKSQFYVEFLGWMGTSGIRGRKYTDPVVQELKRRQMNMTTLPKLTIQLTHKEMKITQELELEEKRKPRAIKKIKFPAIPARDITFVVQSRRSSDRALEDIVACIYLGYMPRTQRYVHVHVYRFDEASTATTFTRLMNELVNHNLNRIDDIERELAQKGEIEDPRLAFYDGMSESTHLTGTDSAVGSVSGSGYSEDGYPTFESQDMEEDLQSLCDVQPFDKVADELKHRLTMKDAPLLLPPKDYDTISRAQGNLIDINERRCLNHNFVGIGGTTKAGPAQMLLTSDQRHQNASEESGIDLVSPLSMVQSLGAENSFVYPPRLERGAGGFSQGSIPLGRQSSQSSAVSTHSSRASQNSDSSHSGERPPPVVCQRRNTFHNLPVRTSGLPLNAGSPINEDLIPPTDYDDDDDPSPRLPFAMRPTPFPSSSPRRASSSDIPTGSVMFMRSLPASVLRNEMSLHSHRGGGVRRVEEEEYAYNGQRRAQGVYPP